MSSSRRFFVLLGLAFATALTTWAVEPADDDPFATSPPPTEAASKTDIVLSGGSFVHPHEQWNLAEKRWPAIDPPTGFDRDFEKPTKVWKVGSGYFATFDAGEFGAAFFYSSGTGHKWIRVMDAHVQDLKYFSDDRVLAVGGLAHMMDSAGAAYLVRRKSDGSWASRKVFASGFGVPVLCGEYSEPLHGGEEAYATIRLKLTPISAEGLGPMFAVTSKGATYYLGVERQNKSEQDVAPNI